MGVIEVSNLYDPWTLFTLCVDLGFPKKQDIVLKNKIKIKIKKGKSKPPQKSSVKSETTHGFLISGFGFEYKSA